MSRRNAMVEAVEAECAGGLARVYRRGGVEYRTCKSLYGVWVGDDGRCHAGKDFPGRPLAVHTLGGKTTYVGVTPIGVRYWLPVARTVYAVFRGPLPHGHRVAFRDGDPGNCAVANLFPSPASHLRRKPPKPPRDVTAAARGLDPAEARLAEYLHSRGKSAESIARRLGCLPGSVELALAEVKAGQRAGGAGKGESPLA